MTDGDTSHTPESSTGRPMQRYPGANRISPTRRPNIRLAVVLVTVFVFAYMPVLLHADGKKDRGGKGTSGLGWAASFALSAAVWVGIMLILFVAYRRIKKAAAAASRLGWVRGDNGLWRTIDAMPFSSPGGMRTSSIFSGRWRGRNAQSLTVTAEMVASADVMELPGPLPRLEIAPHGTNKLAGPNGGDDLDMESAEFNRIFRVATLDREYAHAVLQPRVIERLLEPDARDLSLTISGNCIFVWATPQADPDAAETRLNVLADVADLIPPFVYKRWSTGGDRRVTTDGTAQPVVARTGAKNWLGLTSLVLGLTIFLAPIGIPFGHWARRAMRRGEASNRLVTHYALRVSYAFTFVALPLALMVIFADG
jgi:hypothetical protein